MLCTIAPSPVHELNRAIAIAIARRDGPEAGLALFSAIESEQLETDYYLWHAARAEFAKLTGDVPTAREALERAWQLAPTRFEKEVICRKLDGLPLG
jgi:RNA polymerase sigma-70 factor (ECF subfamily)